MQTMLELEMQAMQRRSGPPMQRERVPCREGGENGSPSFFYGAQKLNPTKLWTTIAPHPIIQSTK